MSPEHVPALTREQLYYQLSKLDRISGLTAADKRVLRDMLLTAANPDHSKLETIIKTLPKARQAEILRIFDEAARMQQAQVEQGNNALLLLGLLTLGSLIITYLLNTDQEALVTAQLFEQNKRIWVQAIQDEIDYCGCTGRARQASGADLEALRLMAENDARSIIATYNKDAQRKLEKLFAEAPNASKQFYIESMKAWATERALWKSLQIAMNTETQAREYARNQFRLHNYAATALYKFAGPTPVCKICVREFAAGHVTLAYIQAHAAPRHINCPHYWTLVRKPKVDCSTLWLG